GPRTSCWSHYISPRPSHEPIKCRLEQKSNTATRPLVSFYSAGQSTRRHLDDPTYCSTAVEWHPLQWSDAGRRHVWHASTLWMGSVRIRQAAAHREPSKSSDRWKDLALEDGVAPNHDGNADRVGGGLCTGAGRGRQRCCADDRGGKNRQQSDLGTRGAV